MLADHRPRCEVRSRASRSRRSACARPRSRRRCAAAPQLRPSPKRPADDGLVARVHPGAVALGLAPGCGEDVGGIGVGIRLQIQVQAARVAADVTYAGDELRRRVEEHVLVGRHVDDAVVGRDDEPGRRRQCGRERWRPRRRGPRARRPTCRRASRGRAPPCRARARRRRRARGRSRGRLGALRRSVRRRSRPPRTRLRAAAPG